MPPVKTNRLHLEKLNVLLLVLAGVLLIAGYIIMSFNEITISAILLVFTYVFLIPFALLYHPNKKDHDSSQ